MSQHRGGSRAKVTKKAPSTDMPFDGFTRFLRQLGGADPKTGKPVKGIYGGLPASAKVVTQYPDGVSTGVGGGNAAQAQSLDPNAPAYIPPTTQPPTRDTPAPSPNPDPGIVQKGTLTGGSRSTPFDMEGFMANIGTPQGINLRNRFASHQLPGSAEHATALNLTPGEFEAAQAAGEVVKLGNGRFVKTSDLNNDNEGAIKTNGISVNATAEQVDSFYGAGNNNADNLEDGRTLTPEKTNWLGRSLADNSDPRAACWYGVS